MIDRSRSLLGSIAAALALLGCDVADADQVLREGETESHPDGTDELREEPPICDLVAHPSVYFIPMRRYTDFQSQVQVDAVWYEHEGRTYEAMCLPDDRGGCRAWIAGWERAGRIRVSTEYCETVVEFVVDVPMDEDGCHVVTQQLLGPVLTLGCLANGPNPVNPPPEPLPH